MPSLCRCLFTLTLAPGVGLLGAPQPESGRPVVPSRPADVIYLPTPPQVVVRMLTLARVGRGDVVYDLGAGDGRIAISAVRDFGAALGVGVELDPQRVQDATRNARAAGVNDRVYFLTQDLFEADLSAATVITLYLLPAVNRRLSPKLRALTSGTRIVSHDYDLGPDWKPDAREVIGGRTLYLFTVRAR